jgi:CheY-like chemotaxis protein
MKLLIVEDDDNKRFQLCQFVQSSFEGTEILQAKSLQSAIRQVRSSVPDIVLLDMTLPNYDPGPDEPGGQTHNFGGREFLRQLERFDISVPVIVVTQFERFGRGKQTIGLSELDDELRAEHGDNYRSSVYYHAAIHGWEEELKTLIQKIVGIGRDVDGTP